MNQSEENKSIKGVVEVNDQDEYFISAEFSGTEFELMFEEGVWSVIDSKSIFFYPFSEHPQIIRGYN